MFFQILGLLAVWVFTLTFLTIWWRDTERYVIWLIIPTITASLTIWLPFAYGWVG